MDIVAYISELLEHQDKLAVPGLGTFYRTRLDGYYSKEQQQFYPPSLQLQFNPELQEDDGVLIGAIAADSRVAPATAQYNIEKFVTNILYLANTENVPLGDLGIFSMRRSQLIFMPKKLNNNNELFYGLAPVKLRRNRMVTSGAPKTVRQMPVTEKPSAFTQALLRGEPMPGKPLSAVNDPDPVEVGEDGKKPARISTWVLVVALVILLSGVGLICAYKVNPALFDRFRGQNEPPPISESDKKIKRHISDSIQHAQDAQRNIGLSPKTDSTTQSKILPPETPRDTFAIVIGKFKDMPGAKKEMDRYKYGGISVRLVRNPAPDPNPIQLIIDETYDKADSAYKHVPQIQKKLTLQDVFVQKYPYKKQQ